MIKAKALVLVTFISVFGAGAVSALVVARLMFGEKVGPGRMGGGPLVREGPGGPGMGPGGGSRGGPSWLAGWLGLSKEQGEKIEKIMSTVREENRDRDEARKEMQRKLQDELLGELTPEQKEKYEAARARTEAAIAKLREASDGAWKDADRKVNELLSAEQLVKMQELRARRDRGGDRGPRGGGGRGGEHQGPGGATSRPGGGWGPPAEMAPPR